MLFAFETRPPAVHFVNQPFSHDKARNLNHSKSEISPEGSSETRRLPKPHLPGNSFASSNFHEKGKPRVHIQHRFFIFTAWEFSPKPSFAAKSKKQLRMVARLQEATTSQDVDQVAVPHRAFVRKFLKFHPSKDHRFPQGN